MNYFIAHMKTVDPEKDAEILEEHINYLNEQIEAGTILAKGPFTDHSGGMIIFNADSLEEAQKIAANDPAAKENSRTFTFKEWKCSRKLS